MEFDRPVFQYPPIGADGAPVPCVTLADFKQLLDDASTGVNNATKRKIEFWQQNCLDKPNVTCSKALKALRTFCSDMVACQIEERRRRSAAKCQPLPVATTSIEVQNSKLLQCSKSEHVQLQTDINFAQNASPSGLASTPSAPQIHFQSLRQSFTNSSAIISF
jgi:hypothetical protein